MIIIDNNNGHLLKNNVPFIIFPGSASIISGLISHVFQPLWHNLLRLSKDFKQVVSNLNILLIEK